MKTFQRSKTNVMLAGVCGGLGEYFNVDPLLFRIIFVIAAFSGSLGIWIYLLLWLFSRPADSNRTDTPNHKARNNDRQTAESGHKTYRRNRSTDNGTVEDIDFTYVDDETDKSPKSNSAL